MKTSKTQDEATLLDVLIDGFEKNEVMFGFHWRQLPLESAEAARLKFAGFVDEARRWKGDPIEEIGGTRSVARWPDLEIRQAGAGVMVLVRSPWFGDWWHEGSTWAHDPMDEIWAWISDDRDREPK